MITSNSASPLKISNALMKDFLIFFKSQERRS